MKRYSDTLTAEVNRKGVLDVDTVKGCSPGMAAIPDGGCYGACYAAKIAKFRGIDFSQAVVRVTNGSAHAARIERAVRSAPFGFFRIGTMGDPCLAWAHTVEVVRWLAPYAVPVIVTKHWRAATDEQFRRLIASGAVLNTSISALDTAAQLEHREWQLARYAVLGGVSVARVVSCDFNSSTPEGERLASIQARLFTLAPVIDNPLRVPRTHELVSSGVIRVQVAKDLTSMRTVSIARRNTYIGHCDACTDRCGLLWRAPGHPKPNRPQIDLFD